MKASHRIMRPFLLAALVTMSAARLEAATALSPSAETVDQVKSLIEAFNNPSFSARRSATQKLDLLGVEAFGPLADAAIQGNSEIVHRVLEILKRGATQNDEATKAAAKEAINRIATSGNRSAARAAAELRGELEQPAVTPRTWNGVGRAGVRIPGPQPRIGQAAPPIQLIPGARAGQWGQQQLMPGVQGMPGLPGPGRMWGMGPMPAQIARREREILIRTLTQIDRMSAQAQQQLLETRDPARAETIRRSLDRHNRMRAEIVEILARGG